MERTPAKRSSLFLLELMIAILFFCLASAVSPEEKAVSMRSSWKTIRIRKK